MNKMKLIIISFLLNLFSHSVYSEIYIDFEREQLIAKKLVERNIAGEPVQLKLAKHEVLALYQQYLSDEKKGAVVLLHPMAGHPDWPGVIQYLREDLPKHGWSTFSIQLPLLFSDEPVDDYGKTFDEASKRINKAVKHLASLNYENIVLIGYGFGAVTGLDSLKKDNPGVLGMIGIGLKPYPYLNPKFNLLKELEGFGLPLLDLYGSNDLEIVIDSAADRRLAIRKAENNFYKQIMVGGADQEFTNQKVILVKRMLVWMDELIAELKISQDNDLDEQNN